MKRFNSSRTNEGAARRVEWLLLGWAVFGLILFVTTKPLWLGRTDFPQVPLIGIGHYIPTWFDTICFVIVITSLIWTIVTSPLQPIGKKPKSELPAPELRTRWATEIRWPLALFTDALVVLVIGNQHRLQPWAYLAWLTAIVAFFCRPKQAIALLRVLVIGVYIHSAITKFDYAFISTLGLSFLKPIKELVGLQMNWGATDFVLASIFPAVELAIGIGLMFQKTRRWMVGLAVGMHIALTFILWRELHHELPVLIWNVYFIWQMVVLFGDGSDSALASTGETLRTSDGQIIDPKSLLAELHAYGRPIAALMVGVALLLPLLEPAGLFDLWPSWGLYAPRASSCELYVDEDKIEKLPEIWRRDAKQFVDAEQGWTPGLEIGLSRKSLEQLKVPIYPQDRFQLGVALSIVREYELGDAATVVWEGTSNRMTGARKRKTYQGNEIESAADRYWLNVEPRRR